MKPRPKLKPCPWCKRTKNLEDAWFSDGSCQIVCVCGAMGPWSMTIVTSIKKWNRRKVNTAKK